MTSPAPPAGTLDSNPVRGNTSLSVTIPWSTMLPLLSQLHVTPCSRHVPSMLHAQPVMVELSAAPKLERGCSP